jgi:hypothetical protein
MAGSSVIGALRVTLGLDAAAFSAGTKKARAEMTTFQRSMSGVATGLKLGFASIIGGSLLSQFGEMARRGREFGSAIGEQAQQLGVSAKALQEYRIIGDQVGISQEKIDKALQMGTKRLGEAALGAKGPSEAYAKLGINIRDAHGNVRNFGDVLPEIASKISGLHSPAERAAMAAKLMGKSASDAVPLLELGAQGIAKYRDEFKKFGIILSDAEIAKLDAAADKMGLLQKVFDAKNAKLTADNADAIIKYEEAVGNLKLTLQKGLVHVFNFGHEMARTGDAIDKWSYGVHDSMVKMWHDSVNAISRMTSDIGNWIYGKLGAVWDWLNKKIEWVANKFEWLDDVVVRHSFVPDMVKSIRDWFYQLQPWMVDPTTAATKKTANAFADMRKEVGALINELYPELAAFEEYKKKSLLIDGMEMSDSAKMDAQRRLGDKYKDAISPPEELLQVSMNTTDLDGPLRYISEITGKWSDASDSMIIANDNLGDSFANMARDISGALSGLIGSIKGGNFFDILNGVLGLLDTAGRAFGGFNIGPMKFGGNGAGGIPKFANGGSMTLGGFTGMDRNLLSLNGRPLAAVSSGETMTISPAANSNGMQVQVVKGDLFDVIVNQAADQRIASAAPGIAAMGARAAHRGAQMMARKRVG